MHPCPTGTRGGGIYRGEVALHASKRLARRAFSVLELRCELITAALMTR